MTRVIWFGLIFFFSIVGLLLRMLTFFLCWQFVVSRSDFMVVMRECKNLFMTCLRCCALGHSYLMDKADCFQIVGEGLEYSADHKKGKKKIGKYW